MLINFYFKLNNQVRKLNKENYYRDVTKIVYQMHQKVETYLDC